MINSLERIREACDKLLYISESEYPFELVHLKDSTLSIEQQLLKLVEKSLDTQIGTMSIEQFLRPMTLVYNDSTPEQQQTAQRFRELQRILLEELTEVQVYLVGRIKVDAFIVGRLKNGDYGGLRTILIET